MAEARVRRRQQFALLPTLPAVAGVGLFLATLWLIVHGALGDIVPARVIGAPDVVPMQPAQWGAWWGASWPTLAFALAVVACEACLGVMLALLLPRRGASAYLALVLLAWPLAVPASVFLLVQAELAPLLCAPLHLDDPWAAWVAAALVDVWRFTPLVALLVYAASSAPGAALHAADLDGLSSLQRVRHVHLPRMRGALAAAVALRTVDVFGAAHLPPPLSGNLAGDLGTRLALSAWRGGVALEALASVGLALLLGGLAYWSVGRGRARGEP